MIGVGARIGAGLILADTALGAMTMLRILPMPVALAGRSHDRQSHVRRTHE